MKKCKTSLIGLVAAGCLALPLSGWAQGDSKFSQFKKSGDSNWTTMTESNESFKPGDQVKGCFWGGDAVVCNININDSTLYPTSVACDWVPDNVSDVSNMALCTKKKCMLVKKFKDGIPPKYMKNGVPALVDSDCQGKGKKEMLECAKVLVLNERGLGFHSVDGYFKSTSGIPFNGWLPFKKSLIPENKITLEYDGNLNQSYTLQDFVDPTQFVCTQLNYVGDDKVTIIVPTS